MRAMFRWLLRILAGLAILTAVALTLAYYVLNQSQINYRQDWTVAGLEAQAEIVRDANAVPHIYAETDHDAYFALGLVHAQERLWQMELARRGAQGRLSEVFGPRAVRIDRRLRSFDLYNIARRSILVQRPETMAALNAYSDGVNAWISTVNEKALGRGAPEFFVFGDGLAPWTPTDSLAILKVMALRLTSSAEKEVRRAKLLRKLTPKQLDDLFPDYPDAGVMALPSFAQAYPGLNFAAYTLRPAETVLEAEFTPRADFGGASNAWAVDAERATAGAPLLANDPHLWLSAPSLWMLAHVEFPDKGVIGATIPGMPVALIGRNRSFGWGLTSVQMDDQDLFIEKVNPDDPNQYLTPAGWRNFETRDEIIQVLGSEPVKIKLRWTRHGPVLPPDVYDVGSVTPKGHVAALSWTALSHEDRTMGALLRINRVNTLEEAVDAVAGVLAPAHNVTMADRGGVGIVVAGRPPARRTESKSLGRIPALGWIAGNDWKGLAPPWTTPRTIRPLSGIVANANNRVSNADFPDHISFDWSPPYRIRRIEQRLNARQYHTLDSFVELQNDAVSEMARSVLPLAARDLWWARDEADDDVVANRRELVLDRLGAWNGEMTEHGPEPLIFTAWIRALTRRIAADELGELFPEIEGARPLFLERVLRDVNGAAEWCDLNKSVRKESCAEITKLALDDALDELSEAHGDDFENWRWGEAHVARHIHTPLGLQFPLSMFVNIEHETSGGDFTILRAKTAGKGATPYQNVHAGGFRAVYDFADLDRSKFIISTGQSGHMLSRHYDGLAEMWRSGGYIPMTMNRQEIEAGALGVSVLTPKNDE
ncbi:MAG: penicillin acylase family protein [Pikeienuella sp.]